MASSIPPIPNPYQRRLIIRVTVGGLCMSFFVLSQITALKLGIPVIWSALAFGAGAYALLFAFNSGEDRRQVHEMNRPGQVIAHWSYSDGEWEDFLVARGLTSEKQRKALPNCDMWITRDGGFIHNTLREWNSPYARLTKVDILKGPIDILHLSYTKRRTKGHQTDSMEISIPVPRRKHAEAESMVREFQTNGRLAPPVKVA